MKKFIIIIMLFLVSCSTKPLVKQNNDLNFNDEKDINKFIIKLKAYSNRNPFPNINN